MYLFIEERELTPVQLYHVSLIAATQMATKTADGGTAKSPCPDERKLTPVQLTSPTASLPTPSKPAASDTSDGQLTENENFSRSFKTGWLQWWKCLHFVKETDKALCFTYCSAADKRLLDQERIRTDNTIVKGG